MDWSDNWRDAFRIELRAEAVGLAARGWPIMPGTYPTSGGWTDGESVSRGGPEPLRADWKLQLADRSESIATAWTERPYSLLVATGSVIDAVDVPAAVGKRVAKLLRTVGVVAPIAATPEGRWYFLTTHADAAGAQLHAHPEVAVRGEGDWIPLPPSAHRHGIVHWRVKPQTCGWQPIEASLVRDAVIRALDDTDAEDTDRPLVAARLSA